MFFRQDNLSVNTVSRPTRQVCTVAVNTLHTMRHAAVPVPSGDRSCRPSPQRVHRVAT